MPIPHQIVRIAETPTSMTFRTVCPFCGKSHEVTLSGENIRAKFEDGMEKWRNGACIQDAFPWMTPDEKEFFLSGICSCFFG